MTRAVATNGEDAFVVGFAVQPWAITTRRLPRLTVLEVAGILCGIVAGTFGVAKAIYEALDLTCSCSALDYETGASCGCLSRDGAKRRPRAAAATASNGRAGGTAASLWAAAGRPSPGAASGPGSARRPAGASRSATATPGGTARGASARRLRVEADAQQAAYGVGGAGDAYDGGAGAHPPPQPLPRQPSMRGLSVAPAGSFAARNMAASSSRALDVNDGLGTGRRVFAN